MGGCLSKSGSKTLNRKEAKNGEEEYRKAASGSTPQLITKNDLNGSTVDANNKSKRKNSSSSSSSSSSSEDEVSKVVKEETVPQPNLVTSATSSTVTSVSQVTSQVNKDEMTGVTKTTTVQHDKTQVVVTSTSEQVTL